MNRYVLCAVALGFVASAPLSASAQMAGALGKPLPVSSMDTGTATVRVIAGSPDKALVGIDVTLTTDDGKTLTARTDGEGRATFNNLQPGKRYVARATEPSDQTDSDQTHEAISDGFIMPQSGGIRMMISTRPWSGPGGPAAGGAGGPMMGAMDPRKMSGIPRGDPAVPAGTMTVAVVRGTVADRLPGHTVHLVSYAADGTAEVITQKTGEDGRAKFENLKPLSHAYYVLTTFDRGHGRSPDRVMSDPITMPPRVGVRMLLAGTPEKDALKPPIDDLAFLARQNDRIRTDELLIQFWFRDRNLAPKTAKLFEMRAGAEAPIEVTTATIDQPTPADVDAEFSNVLLDANQPAASLAVNVVASGQQSGPLPNIGLTLEPVTPAPPPDSADGADGAKDVKKDAKDESASEAPAVPDGQGTVPAPTPRVTDSQGRAQFTGLTVGKSYKLAVTFVDRRLVSPPITIPPGDAGQRIQVAIAWRFDASGESRFTGLQPGKLYYVEAMYEGRIQRTRPMQMVPERGAIVGLPLYSKPLFSFHMVGGIDDEYLGFSGEIGLINMSAMPWDPGPNGLIIPFPKGFIGGGVEEDVQDTVKVEPDRGLLLRGLMSPGRMRFRAGFSLPVAGGGARFDQNLDLGVFKGSIILIKNPGMQVLDVPSGIQIQEREAKDGRQFFQLDNINFQAGSQLSFTISGLPERPAAERYTRYAVGFMALLFLSWALFHVLARRQTGPVMVAAGVRGAERSRLRKLEKRREELLEQLVELEGQKRSRSISGDAYKKARSKLRGKLETVYADIDKLERD